MQRERVADDVFVFTSDLYAQVTAGVVVTTDGVVLIDTLLFPEETLAIKRFVENRLGTSVRYVINTHFHADHTTGTSFFPDAQVISHTLCRQILDERGRDSLARFKSTSPDMDEVKLVLPQIVFSSGVFNFYLGNKSFQLWSTPGHSPDSIVCLLKEDRILFAADTLMPLPYFVDGSYDDFLVTLDGLRGGSYENVVQGHGEVILRGEVEEKLQNDVEYLHKLRDAVDDALTSRSPDKALNAITPERCGKSRILLHGAVDQLHRNNVVALAAQRRELVQL
jgi:cyclase